MGLRVGLRVVMEVLPVSFWMEVEEVVGREIEPVEPRMTSVKDLDRRRGEIEVINQFDTHMFTFFSSPRTLSLRLEPIAIRVLT